MSIKHNWNNDMFDKYNLKHMKWNKFWQIRIKTNELKQCLTNTN